jgi:hypothetical protein
MRIEDANLITAQKGLITVQILSFGGERKEFSKWNDAGGMFVVFFCYIYVDDFMLEYGQQSHDSITVNDCDFYANYIVFRTSVTHLNYFHFTHYNTIN